MLGSNWWSRCTWEGDGAAFRPFLFPHHIHRAQSHLCNHGDADKVTHDYSSVVPSDWTAPESLAKRIHQRSLCPRSTSMCPSGWWESISAALSLFSTFSSCLNLTPHHLTSLLITCPPLMSQIFLSQHLSLLSFPLACCLRSLSIDDVINHSHIWHELPVNCYCNLVTNIIFYSWNFIGHSIAALTLESNHFVYIAPNNSRNDLRVFTNEERNFFHSK